MAISYVFDQNLFEKLGVAAPAVLEADATIDEEHDLSVEYTSYPVEDGTNISDHARRIPSKFKMSVAVIGTETEVNRKQSRIGQNSASVSAVFELDFEASRAYQKRKIQMAFDEFRQIMSAQDPKLYTVVHSLGFYSNMVIENVSVPRDAEHVNYAVFSITFKEIEIAKMQTTTAPKVKVGAENTPAAGAKQQAQGKAVTGKQATENKALSAKWRDGDVDLSGYFVGGIKAGLSGF